MKKAYITDTPPKYPISLQIIETPLEGSWERMDDNVGILFKFNVNATEEDISDVALNAIADIEGGSNYKEVFYWLIEVVEYIQKELKTSKK
jgi:hypothetical protein